MKSLKCLLAGAVIGILSVPALAQSFNVDVNTATVGGAGLGPPTAVFGAAAGQVGSWNAISGIATLNIALNGLNGLPTASTFTRSSAAGGNFAFNNAQTLGDTQLLMDDGQDLSATTVPVIYTFGNLAAGTYDVYTYAAAPDFAAVDATAVTINGLQLISTGPIPVGGTFAPGITHTLHTGIAVAAGGSIAISADGINGGFGTINGFQLVLIPAPGALALLGLAGLVGSRRRRA